MRYYIIAGEASGDLHGSNLIKEIKKKDPAAAIRCWGGDMMQAAGATLVKHYRSLAFMGFAEVIKNLPTIFKNLRFCKEDILSWQPDVLVLIDYPGFNLRIAAWAKQQGLKIAYYISPQVWAWKENRVKQIRQHVDRMLVILPFEKKFYQKWQYPVQYVGHPLIEVIEEEQRRPAPAALASKPIIALLPGSRQQEIIKKLPIMLSVAAKFPDHQFIVAKAPGLAPSFYDGLLSAYNNVSAVSGQTYALLRQARAALVTSGTATLETALFAVPEVVCYKSSRLSYAIGKRLIRVKYISLVNLIMDKPVVKELIQDNLTTANLQQELQDLLYNPQRIAQLTADYQQLKQLLTEGGRASANAAASIVSLAVEK
ncbi:MAG TPA: lipid-A-disaccharide synthase [Chitinophagaceae bacterium]|nr:lipid-A-disaccharide synthase [Chitinophagaceae bacterium]